MPLSYRTYTRQTPSKLLHTVFTTAKEQTVEIWSNYLNTANPVILEIPRLITFSSANQMGCWASITRRKHLRTVDGKFLSQMNKTPLVEEAYFWNPAQPAHRTEHVPSITPCSSPSHTPSQTPCTNPPQTLRPLTLRTSASPSKRLFTTTSCLPRLSTLLAKSVCPQHVSPPVSHPQQPPSLSLVLSIWVKRGVQC